MKALLTHHRHGVAALIAGLLALAVSGYTVASHAMNDGDISTPGFFFTLTALFSFEQAPQAPVMSATPLYLLLDSDKQQLAAVVSSLLAILSFLSGLVSRRRSEYSMLHATGILGGVSAIALLSPWNGLLAAILVAISLALLPACDRSSG